MDDVIFEDDGTNEDVEEILYDMSSPDFLLNEINEQLDDEILNSNKRNYVNFYIDKYKYLKKIYSDVDDDKVEELKENKRKFLEDVLTIVSDRFNINIITDEINNRLVKTLYGFFVTDYADNIYNLFINYINKNKKSIIAEIKKLKKTRDISTVASKNKYVNVNDTIILNNINFVVFDLIPSVDLSEDFISIITETDDDVINMNMNKFIDKELIEINDDTYELFLQPFLDQVDGYSDIISRL